MKVLDRYLLRELFSPILNCLLVLTFLMLVADLFDNLDDLLRNKTPILAAIQYYVSLLPFVVIQVMPWAAWMGTVFMLINFGFHNEITAMKVAGLKITTIIRPLLFLGFLIGIVSFLISDRIVPRTYQTANELREIYIDKKKDKTSEKSVQNLTYFADANRLYYFRTFFPSRNEGQDIIVLWLDGTQTSSRQKMVAQRGVWKDTAWEFENVTEYSMDSQGRILGEPRQFPQKKYPEINVSPKDLYNASSDSNFLSYRELKRSIGKLKENGVRVYSELVDLHSRLASPWQGMVMMLTVVPFLARTTPRKVIAVNVLICVGIAFAYHVLGAVGMALGKAGKLFPFLGAWMGNILFSIGALFYLEKSNY